MPPTPKTKSDAQGYLERRGWEKNPSNNVWRRVERTRVPEKTDAEGNVLEGEKIVANVLDEVLEPEALDLQHARDIEYLLARVEGPGRAAGAVATSLPVTLEIDDKALAPLREGVEAFGAKLAALLEENAKLAARVAAIEAVLTDPAPAQAPAPAPAKPTGLFAKNAAPSKSAQPALAKAGA